MDDEIEPAARAASCRAARKRQGCPPRARQPGRSRAAPPDDRLASTGRPPRRSPRRCWSRHPAVPDRERVHRRRARPRRRGGPSGLCGVVTSAAANRAGQPRQPTSSWACTPERDVGPVEPARGEGGVLHPRRQRVRDRVPEQRDHPRRRRDHAHGRRAFATKLRRARDSRARTVTRRGALGKDMSVSSITDAARTRGPSRSRETPGSCR